MVKHLSEEELQLYVLDSTQCPGSLTDHLSLCSECQRQLSAYKVLFSSLGQQPKPKPEFDIKQLVMPKLSPEPGRAADHFVAAFLVVFVAAVVTVFLYVFHSYFLNFFGSIPSVFVYAILGGGAVILAMYILVIYKHFRKQMRFLNTH